MTWMRLADRCAAATAGGRVVLIDGDDSYALEGAPLAVAEVLNGLKTGGTRADVVAQLGEAAADELLALLDEAGFLRSAPLPRSGEHYERQLGLWDDFGDAAQIQRRLGDAVVAVVGIGGIGAPLCQHLAASGVGGLVVFDGDAVAIDNLNRQHPYTRDDVGTPKPHALARAVARVAPDVRVVGDPHYVEDPDRLAAQLGEHDVDLLVVAADRPFDILERCYRAAAMAGVAVSGAAVGRYAGHWGPLLAPGQTACPECAVSILALDAAEREEAAGSIVPMRASFGPSNALIADWLAHDVIRFLAGAPAVASVGRRMELSMTDPHIGESAAFPACGHWASAADALGAASLPQV